MATGIATKIVYNLQELLDLVAEFAAEAGARGHTADTVFFKREIALHLTEHTLTDGSKVLDLDTTIRR